jgi:lamin tail-like protein
MRVKMIASAVIAVAALSLPLARVSPVNAATVPVVYIHVIQYSPAGPDIPVTTAKLDGEWVLLTNTTGKSVSLTHWTLRDKANHIYVFPAFTLKAHKSVEIHTGTGKNNAANLYWGHKPPKSTSYVWNNSGKETATLKSAAGRTVDARSYTGRSVSGAAQAIFKP